MVRIIWKVGNDMQMGVQVKVMMLLWIGEAFTVTLTINDVRWAGGYHFTDEKTEAQCD